MPPPVAASAACYPGSLCSCAAAASSLRLSLSDTKTCAVSISSRCASSKQSRINNISLYNTGQSMQCTRSSCCTSVSCTSRAIIESSWERIHLRTIVPGSESSTANSLRGAKVPIGPWPIRSLELSLPDPFVPWNFRSLELSLHGANWPWNFRSLELSFSRVFAPRNFR